MSLLRFDFNFLEAQDGELVVKELGLSTPIVTSYFFKRPYS